MKQTKITVDPADFPAEFRPLLGNEVWDSSCSPTARVWYLPRHACYLKRAPKGTLAAEATMTRYFHQKGLSAEVLSYTTLEEDWLLTSSLAGKDLTHAEYLANPKRLCDALGEALRRLHALPTADCPVQNKNELYLKTAAENRKAGLFDPSYSSTPLSEEDAWKTVEAHRSLLQTEVLLHGDYCLPNLMLDHWQFSGFLDLGAAGAGDRHIDLFWGAWSLCYNLKTDAYRTRFFEAYGKDKVDPQKLQLIGCIECFG